MPYRRSRPRNVLLAMAVLAAVACTSAYAALAIGGEAPVVTRDALAAAEGPAGAKGKRSGSRASTSRPGRSSRCIATPARRSHASSAVCSPTRS